MLKPLQFLRQLVRIPLRPSPSRSVEEAPPPTVVHPPIGGAVAYSADPPPRRKRRRRRRPSGERADARTGAEAPGTGQDSPSAPPGFFGGLQVSAGVSRALQEMGYLEPTPVQSQVVPLLLGNRDVVGQAQTGTGKTAAFGIPLAEVLDPRVREVQAIVLVPTRELALQVSGELSRLTAHTGHRVVTLYGGQPIIKQFSQLTPTPQIVVGTPGRVLDHLGRGTVRFDSVRVAILDEADEMLDIGFAPDMERILRLTPKARQTALFSATMPPFIMRMIRRYLRDPAWVHIDPEALTVPEIDQVYYEVAQRDKLDALAALLEEWGTLPRALIFCRMQVGVDRLTAALRRQNHQVEGIHGGLTQAERTRIMTGFRKGAIQALIATNVAARGLDIPDITHVVSYDAPQNPEEYIHRIGRTGRMGRQGLAITFISESDLGLLDQIAEQMGDALRQERSSIYGKVAV